ncbi:hypothetical protein M2322_002789 [Rhodoblastus acidophilus]|uniref:hypothetical protein n=1 Tax=Rhodoblastus acidophilus TaxID=1074 RepID=UPI0022247B53|nr:hypothetical protein [Rhodoblastus acidophilus]MCW2317230.1 hypothetical protein [Rhodoblastus acidophilus]
MSEAENGAMLASPQNEYSIRPDGVAKWCAHVERLSVTPQAGGLKRLAVDCGDMTLWEIFRTGEQARHLAELLLGSEGGV